MLTRGASVGSIGRLATAPGVDSPPWCPFAASGKRQATDHDASTADDHFDELRSTSGEAAGGSAADFGDNTSAGFSAHASAQPDHAAVRAADELDVAPLCAGRTLEQAWLILLCSLPAGDLGARQARLLRHLLVFSWHIRHECACRQRRAGGAAAGDAPGGQDHDCYAVPQPREEPDVAEDVVRPRAHLRIPVLKQHAHTKSHGARSLYSRKIGA